MIKKYLLWIVVLVLISSELKAQFATIDSLPIGIMVEGYVNRAKSKFDFSGVDLRVGPIGVGFHKTQGVGSLPVSIPSHSNDEIGDIDRENIKGYYVNFNTYMDFRELSSSVLLKVGYGPTTGNQNIRWAAGSKFYPREVQWEYGYVFGVGILLYPARNLILGASFDNVNHFSLQFGIGFMGIGLRPIGEYYGR